MNNCESKLFTLHTWKLVCNVNRCEQYAKVNYLLSHTETCM